MGKNFAAKSRNFRLMAAALVLLASLSLASMPIAAADNVWRRQDSGGFAQLLTVFFLDQNLGWAAGGHGALLRTEDGGATWKALKHPSEDAIRDLGFWNREEGWALFERNIFLMKSMDEARSYLMRTHDGGTTWEKVDLTNIDLDARFTRLIMAGEGRGWLLGEAGTLYLTNDRGQTWKRQVPPARYLLLGGTFLDASHGWLAGGGASICRTVDGGANWRSIVVREAPGARFTAITFATINRGWVVGNSGLIFATSDGGRSWVKQASGIEADLSDVRFVDQSEGWVIGGSGTLLHTTDGGSHWSNAESGTAHPLERLIMLDRAHGWAVGFGGTIISLTRPGQEQPPVLRH